jgi:hypothetical protein
MPRCKKKRVWRKTVGGYGHIVVVEERSPAPSSTSGGGTPAPRASARTATPETGGGAVWDTATGSWGRSRERSWPVGF